MKKRIFIKQSSEETDCFCIIRFKHIIHINTTYGTKLIKANLSIAIFVCIYNCLLKENPLNQYETQKILLTVLYQQFVVIANPLSLSRPSFSILEKVLLKFKRKNKSIHVYVQLQIISFVNGIYLFDRNTILISAHIAKRVCIGDQTSSNYERYFFFSLEL